MNNPDIIAPEGRRNVETRIPSNYVNDIHDSNLAVEVLKVMGLINRNPNLLNNGWSDPSGKRVLGIYNNSCGTDPVRTALEKQALNPEYEGIHVSGDIICPDWIEKRPRGRNHEDSYGTIISTHAPDSFLNPINLEGIASMMSEGGTFVFPRPAERYWGRNFIREELKNAGLSLKRSEKYSISIDGSHRDSAPSGAGTNTLENIYVFAVKPLKR
ncbi:MAG: hypothetical protein R6U32_02575 [Candidatus Woesearchaeota archaeon]